MYNSCSGCCLITTTSISDSYRHNLPVRRHRASCFGVNTVFGSRIDVDSRRIAITKTIFGYSDRSFNQTTLRIDCRVTTLSTTRVDEGNCRNKVVTRTRVGDLNTRDLSCRIINSNFSSSTRTIDQIARFSDTNNRRVICSVTLTTVDQFNVFNTIDQRPGSGTSSLSSRREDGYLRCKVQSITTTTFLDSNCFNFTISANTSYCLSTQSNRRRHILDRTNMECILSRDVNKEFDSSVVISQHIIIKRALQHTVTVDDQTNFSNRSIREVIILNHHRISTNEIFERGMNQFFNDRISKTDIVKNLSQFYLVITSSSTRCSGKDNLRTSNNIVNLRNQQITIYSNCKVCC